MRAVVQRVHEAAVSVGGSQVAAIGPGLVVLVGIAEDDSNETAERLATKIAALRIFENHDGRFDRSLVDVSGAVLVVSQFTLMADTTKGNRPSFTHAADPGIAELLYERFCAALDDLGVPVSRGIFGARMDVALVGDGPVTIALDV